MKKISCLFISLVILISFASCGKKDDDVQIEETTNPIVTENPSIENDTSAPETTASAVAETTAPITTTEFVSHFKSLGLIF